MTTFSTDRNFSFAEVVTKNQVFLKHDVVKK